MGTGGQAEVLFDIEMLARGDTPRANEVAEEAYAHLDERGGRWPYLSAFLAQARYPWGGSRGGCVSASSGLEPQLDRAGARPRRARTRASEGTRCGAPAEQQIDGRLWRSSNVPTSCSTGGPCSSTTPRSWSSWAEVMRAQDRARASPRDVRGQGRPGVGGPSTLVAGASLRREGPSFTRPDARAPRRRSRTPGRWSRPHRRSRGRGTAIVVRDLGSVGRPERVDPTDDHLREVRAVGGEGVDRAWLPEAPDRDAVARRRPREAGHALGHGRLVRQDLVRVAAVRVRHPHGARRLRDEVRDLRPVGREGRPGGSPTCRDTGALTAFGVDDEQAHERPDPSISSNSDARSVGRDRRRRRAQHRDLSGRVSVPSAWKT